MTTNRLQMVFLSLLLLFLVPFQTLVLAADNGFDSSMDMPMSLASGSMLTYLHFTPGDVLWFDGWVPGRGSTLFAACVGLFLLGLAERWATALRAGLDMAMVRDVQLRKKDVKVRQGKNSNCATKIHTAPLRDVILLRGGTAAPFILDHAWARFVLHSTQATINILFMLTIMTFQLSFIFSLAIGVAVGEMMYGRFTDAVRAELDGDEVNL